MFQEQELCEEAAEQSLVEAQGDGIFPRIWNDLCCILFLMLSAPLLPFLQIDRQVGMVKGISH